MPHLQLDTSGTYSVDVKREFARRLGDVYAEKMQTSPDIVDVTVREHGPGGVWRSGSEPHPSAVLSCDIRRGRTVEQRAQLADALVDVAVDVLGVDDRFFNVEFTQHDGDEIYGSVDIDGVVHRGFAPNWSPSEATRPLLEQVREAWRVPDECGVFPVNESN
jgi:phenylpyruvate tautomerase PptA (4-oxalocrotonate tautomerase family)